MVAVEMADVRFGPLKADIAPCPKRAEAEPTLAELLGLATPMVTAPQRPAGVNRRLYFRAVFFA
jgi:hypothetical protein